MEVFLGGTCSGYKWRNELIPMLKCDYYNPMTRGWDEKTRQREVKERDGADYVLYVVTSNIRGVYSIAEVVDDSNKRPEKTIFCVLYDGMKHGMRHSLRAVVNMVKNNGATVCESLVEVAEFLNKQND
jgi:effector-binding domain-containing protein